MRKKLHLPALVALGTTAFGVVSSPLVMGLVPPHWAAVIVGAGALAQSLTKALHAGQE
jgi:hypothetical protein